MMDLYELEHLCLRMRRRILDMSLRCEGPTHLGGGLSIVEITAALYGSVLKFDPNNPQWDDRDRFILSKGHGVLGLYTALAEVGVIDETTFLTFKQTDSHLISHPVMNVDLGIESSNGSLGQGLSLAIGISWGARFLGKTHHQYVLLGDGECNEGSVWEAAMAASQMGLQNITVIVDNNGFQSDGSTEAIMTSTSLAERWSSFGWDVSVVDGHNLDELCSALRASPDHQQPRCIVARTVKGRGISFMENNNEWHHNRLTQAWYDKAIEELGQGFEC